MPAERSRRNRRHRAAARPRASTTRAPAEARLLRLAREVADLAGTDAGRSDPVAALIDRLAAAVARPGRRADKDRALALGWAREQLRLAVADVLARAVAGGHARADVDRDMLAWLVVAAAATLADEPVEAAADRARALREFLRPG